MLTVEHFTFCSHISLFTRSHPIYVFEKLGLSQVREPASGEEKNLTRSAPFFRNRDLLILIASQRHF